ncbi:MAG: amidohydrolase family protein [Verrucomicrobiae bacterium]|nr:amidohydrolase family protein [Verrucomicrobiae bacterium]
MDAGVGEIWDVHCHLAGVPGDTPEARLKELIRYADRLGIQRLCVCMGMDWSHDPTPGRLRHENDEVLRAVGFFPERTFGFVYLNPKYTTASIDELRRCVADGPMVGVKLWVAEKCSSRLLDPIVRLAVELQAPIYQHTWIKVAGNLPGESTPFDLVELARRHPDARFICGHCGGDWELGIRAVRSCPNILVELSGGDPVAGVTEMAVRELGAARVLFGSDAGGRSFASQLAKVTSANISDTEKRMILSGNLKRLLRPILEKKGVSI